MSKHSTEQTKAKIADDNDEEVGNVATSESTTLKKTEHHSDENEIDGKKYKLNFRTRKFPIWLRIVVVLVLLIISLLLGLIVGYAFFGDGDVVDALKIETYKHILDIVNKEK